MKILILGGTLFLGRHLVEAAGAGGHEVTIFHRGRTNPDLFPDIERLIGDREADLDALRGRSWDAVVDTSGYLPRAVRASADLLRDAVDRYLFVSSISVYADTKKLHLVESDAVARLEPGTPEELTGDTYGPLKALCEEALEEALPGRVTSVRAGLIFGPHDSTERSAYWPARAALGGTVLAPGRPERAVQLIDPRDLAAWMVRLCEARASGVFNATGPESTLTMEVFLETCRAVGGGDARFVWVDDEFLLRKEVGPYAELPLWVPAEYQAFGTVDCSKAIAAGLRFRPLAETVRATLEWDRVTPKPRPRKPGVQLPPPLTLEREATLLEEWRSTRVAGTAQSNR